MRQGLSYFQATIFDTLPVFLRRMDTALAKIGQPRIPLSHTLFKFGAQLRGTALLSCAPAQRERPCSGMLLTPVLLCCWCVHRSTPAALIAMETPRPCASAHVT